MTNLVQPGQGESEKAPGGFLVWALAADLAAFVDAVGLDRFDLVGLSLGSRCSMASPRDNWRRIRHLAPGALPARAHGHGPGPGGGPRRARGLYANRYDRRLADITTKAAIPEISYLWDSLTRIQCPTLVLRGEHAPTLAGGV